ncbi:MAG: dTDP-4-dehydrorhamnose 3,5-epimerase [Devosia sp.]
MKVTKTRLGEVLLLEPVAHQDHRGTFFESFNARAFAENVTGGGHFVQDNQSISKQGVLRGLHFQLPPRAQGKLVRAVAGEIFDVAVDIRKSSPTFGRWAGEILSAANRRQLWVPPGFAHGFLALSDGAEVLYKTTDFYDQTAERAIRWDDPDIGIEWPAEFPPILSPKDAGAPPLSQAEIFE